MSTMLRTQFLSLMKNGSSRVLSGNFNALSSAGSQGSLSSSGEPRPPPPESTEPLGGKGIDGWQIMAAICVTRHPILCPPMTPIEHTYSEHLNKVEVELSIQSDFELQIIEDNARKVLGEDEVDLDSQAGDQRSALEMLDMWKQEHTEFDEIKNTALDVPESSVGSSLSRQVVLVQKHKIGSQDVWILPQGPWKPGETLRQTSERIAAESCDPSLGVRIMGNAPVGFYKYKYPKEIRTKGYIGAKVFFYRGQVSSRVRRSLPALQHNGKQDQIWMTRPQIKDRLKTSYVKAITQFLVDDS